MNPTSVAKPKDWGKIIICGAVIVFLVIVGVFLSLIYFFTSILSTGWFFASIFFVVSAVSVAGMIISHSGLTAAEALTTRLNNTNFVNEALRKEIGVQREISDSLEERPGTGTFWKITRRILSEDHSWDLNRWVPAQHRICPKPKHQYYAVLIPHEKTSDLGLKDTVVLLNLRALGDKKEVAIWAEERVTDWEEFEEKLSRGDFDREEKVLPEIPLDRITAELGL